MKEHAVKKKKNIQKQLIRCKNFDEMFELLTFTAQLPNIIIYLHSIPMKKKAVFNIYF